MIDNLVGKGKLLEGDAAILQKLRVMGNKAAHEVKPHRIRGLRVALEIVEHLLSGIYINPTIAADL